MHFLLTSNAKATLSKKGGRNCDTESTDNEKECMFFSVKQVYFWQEKDIDSAIGYRQIMCDYRSEHPCLDNTCQNSRCEAKTIPLRFTCI